MGTMRYAHCDSCGCSQCRELADDLTDFGNGHPILGDPPCGPLTSAGAATIDRSTTGPSSAAATSTSVGADTGTRRSATDAPGSSSPPTNANLTASETTEHGCYLLTAVVLGLVALIWRCVT